MIANAKKKKGAEPAEQQDGPKATRPRSPNHPAFPLETAIEKVKALHDKYGRTPIAVALACSNWGYKNPRSSGALQHVSSLRSYGLLDGVGRGDAQKLVVSEAAERILRNAPDRDALLRDVALSPTLHLELWNQWSSTVPHDDVLRRYLVWERTPGARFTDEAVGDFIREYRDTLRFAGITSGDDEHSAEQNSVDLDSSENENGPKTPRREVQVGSFVQWTSAGVDQFPKPMKVAGLSGNWAFVEGSRTGIPMSELTVVDPPTTDVPKEDAPLNPFYAPPKPEDGPAAPGVDLERMTLSEGPVTLNWPAAMSRESLEEFEYWVNGLIRKAKRKAGVPLNKGKKDQEGS